MSKVFTRILLRKMQQSVDQLLRAEQAGFRKGRSFSDQIFTLRNIIEQCVEGQATVYLNFIDYEKAFDSIHRESLWALLHHNGIPQKIINRSKHLTVTFAVE